MTFLLEGKDLNANTLVVGMHKCNVGESLTLDDEIDHLDLKHLKMVHMFYSNGYVHDCPENKRAKIDIINFWGFNE